MALHIEVCPETGICSIIRDGSQKVDIMPDDVMTIRDAEGAPQVVRDVVADNDAAFAAALTDDEVGQIGRRLG